MTCKINNCNKIVFANSVCSMHYNRKRRHNSYETPKTRKGKLYDDFSHSYVISEDWLLNLDEVAPNG